MMTVRAPLALLVVAALLWLPAAPVSAATPGAAADECFAQTGYCARGRFLDYWRAHGGLARNGYPLTGEFVATLEDGRPYTVQYFERARLEYHPENAPPYDVLLGQFGRRILATIPDAPVEPAAADPANPAGRYFAETGHNVRAPFRGYWEAYGGLAQFGYPLSEEFEQQLEDGATYRVQYFERARFEFHPELAAQWQVELGQFGRRILAQDGGTWLDQPQPKNWNLAGEPLPPAPAPIGEAATSGRCGVHTPATPSAEERAVMDAGRSLVREPERGGGLTVVTGIVAVDGMCRPLQYQAFAFLAGTYAGTLSPLTMNSREDGALDAVAIAADGRAAEATYRRYDRADPACCPARTSRVLFGVDTMSVLIVPVRAETAATAQ